jgi:predicted 3-demethylubiquinone-9 3-methyltransferase (glyoxalase superfamily)
MSKMTIVPCLWFDGRAEEAANFYVSIFKSSKVKRISHFGAEGQEIHGRPPGSVMTVDFELDGTPFTALNGGPQFKFNEALSLQVMCKSQHEIDHFWDKLSEGGDPSAQQCGWLKDKFGVSWQIVPAVMAELLEDPVSARSERTMAALLKMKKLDIDALKRAYGGPT